MSPPNPTPDRSSLTSWFTRSGMKAKSLCNQFPILADILLARTYSPEHQRALIHPAATIPRGAAKVIASITIIENHDLALTLGSGWGKATARIPIGPKQCDQTQIAVRGPLRGFRPLLKRCNEKSSRNASYPRRMRQRLSTAFG